MEENQRMFWYEANENIYLGINTLPRFMKTIGLKIKRVGSAFSNDFNSQSHYFFR